MAEKPKNALSPSTPAQQPVNALRGDREDIKAYLGLLGLDDSVMTEKHLSPQAVEVMRQTVQKALSKPYTDSADILNAYPYSDADPTNGTRMHHVVGKVAPGNLRQVKIGGVPYYQVIDRYDFDLGKEGQGGWQQGLMDTIKDLAKHPVDVINPVNSLSSPWGPEQFAGQLGLQRNLNYLIPVDPRHVAPDELVEAHRKQTNLPYPSKTLGGMVVNHLSPKSRYPEKAMP